MITTYTPNDSLTIVYVSEAEPRLMAWRGGENWAIFPTDNMPRAMAMSVFYAPHAVIIDGDADWLDETLAELVSVSGPSARGRDVIIRVGGSTLLPDAPDFIDLISLPSDITPDALAAAVRAAVQGARLPKVVA